MTAVSIPCHHTYWLICHQGNSIIGGLTSRINIPLIPLSSCHAGWKVNDNHYDILKVYKFCMVIFDFVWFCKNISKRNYSCSRGLPGISENPFKNSSRFCIFERAFTGVNPQNITWKAPGNETVSRTTPAQISNFFNFLHRL